MKGYKAIYRIDNDIFAEGSIIMYDNKTIEGIFAFDYMHIYEYGKNSFCFLKTLSYFVQTKVLMQEKKQYKFYSSKQTFNPSGTYFFFNNSNIVLSLEIKEEITDQDDIKILLMDIAKNRS